MADSRWAILGGGFADLSAADAARDARPDAHNTLVHRESELPFNRLNLTRYLAGYVSRDTLVIQPGRAVRLLANNPAHVIQPEKAGGSLAEVVEVRY